MMLNALNILVICWKNKTLKIIIQGDLSSKYPGVVLKATDVQKGNEIKLSLGLAGLFEYFCALS